MRVIVAVEGDQAQLGGEDTDLGLVGDAEQVFGIGVVLGDPRAKEIVIQVLDLLVAGEQHQPPRPQGDLIVIVQIFVQRPAGDVGRNIVFFFHHEPPVEVISPS